MTAYFRVESKNIAKKGNDHHANVTLVVNWVHLEVVPPPTYSLDAKLMT
ncbi:MAG: hypothetical protein LBC20_12515 [Planctomycetaceae bacterium]|nr:hypothetical protein [Planctomycetaceae bacterium]